MEVGWFAYDAVYSFQDGLCPFVDSNCGELLPPCLLPLPRCDAMRLSLFTLGHPEFVTTPLLCIASYISCHVFPVCQVSRILAPFGLRFVLFVRRL